MSPIVNNVTRLLDAKKIPYTICELPAEKIGALEAARILGVPSELVYKTLVIKRESKGKPILAVVPGTKEVNLKALARTVGEKKLHLATEREAEQMTGLQVGGISALALLNRGFKVILDSSASIHHEIYVSGGQRGLDICIPVGAFVSLTNAIIADIAI